MRLYIRLNLTETTTRQCLHWQKVVCEPLRKRYRLDLIDPPLLHLTIAELRHVNEEQSARVQTEVRRINELDEPSVRTRAVKIDWFPSSAKPSVIAAIIHLNEDIAAIYGAVRNELNTLGVDILNRPIRPHVTLARVHQKSIAADDNIPMILDENECSFRGLSCITR